MSFSRRVAVAFGLALACFAALGVRLVQVQVIAAGDYRAAGRRQASARVTLPEPRGEIRDRHGSPMAYSEPGFDLWVDMGRIGDLGRAAEDLAGALGTDGPGILRRLARGGSAVRLARALSMEEAGAVRYADLRGLRLEETSRRMYPLGPACCHLLGVVGADGRGLEGLEFAWEEVLAGRPGMRRLRWDAHRKMIDLGDAEEHPGLRGANLVLTIDAGLQLIVHEELTRAALDLRPLGGAAVVMDPATGDVLALCSWPSYEPSERGSAPAAAARNRAVQDALEPGSTFKPFVFAWAVEHGTARPGEKIDCENGAWRAFEARTIHDSHPHGMLSLEEGLVFSSNIMAAKIGRRLGRDGLYECVRAFGFGERTGVRLPGEARGLVGPRTAWSSHTVVSVPFGQELAVTPLQLATGYAALINGGLRVRPRVIDRLVDEEGRTLRELGRAEPERILSEATSSWLRRVLRRVVEEGTGRRARVPGLSVGGKTGTAQKYERDPATGLWRPSAKESIASFIGFAPAEEPRLLCLVMWDAPQGARSGGLAAAPVVARILRRAFEELGAD